MKAAMMLAALLRDPTCAGQVPAGAWGGILCAARAERLAGSLAARLAGYDVPGPARAALADSAHDAAMNALRCRWEVEQLRAVLQPLGIATVLLKGAAFVLAGLDAGLGRQVGDTDILVPRDRLDEAEAALLAAGWEWVKDHPYDQAYYRRWMHELPPLIHRTRDSVLDVHHTILPLTARHRPQASALLADSVALQPGVAMLSPPDMLVHAAAHLIADGDAAGGLRNLWDIDRLFRQYSGLDSNLAERLEDRAALHALSGPVARALRLAHALYATPVAPRHRRLLSSDRLFVARITARDGWGRSRRPLLRAGFYLRSHWLRMPPAMLARHLFTKWRMGRGGG